MLRLQDVAELPLHRHENRPVPVGAGQGEVLVEATLRAILPKTEAPRQGLGVLHVVTRVRLAARFLPAQLA